ncbi:30S ribosomal protein S12 methylthiotransferase RimO [bacterium]|nr:30S ribosomal protein S12 methylthiotransferase RimO [bacterium]
MLKLFIISLGCAKNQVDTESMMGCLLPTGFTVTDNPQDADVLLVNTCSFIEPAREESIESILELVNIKSNAQKLIVAGCLPQRYGLQLENEIPEVDLWLDIASEDSITEKVAAWFPEQLSLVNHKLSVRLTPRHYAYLRVADGCNHVCSFCAIPGIRGELKSVPQTDVIDNAREMAEQGVIELNVIAQDTSSYGKDFNNSKYSLPSLLKQLCKIDGIKWIRLQYLYPASITDDLIDVIACENKICPYFDIPLQHIADKVLRSMKRPGKDFTLNLLEKIRKSIPEAAIRTSVIVGYPNEDEPEFNELKQFISDFKFNLLGVFQYSREEDTSAFNLEDPVSEKIKNDRQCIIMEMQQQISLENNNKLIGKILPVIIDSIDEANAIGRTVWDAPEVDGLVYIEKNPEIKQGTIVDVEIINAETYDLFGTLIH